MAQKVDHDKRRELIKEQVFDLMLELDINYMPKLAEYPRTLYNAVRYYFNGFKELKIYMNVLNEVEYVKAICDGRIKKEAIIEEARREEYRKKPVIYK